MKAEGKRTIDEQAKVSRRLILSAKTDHILAQCAIIQRMPRGQVVDVAIIAYATAYNIVVTAKRTGPPNNP